MPKSVIVLGAGVVGLSLARELRLRSIEVDLLEARRCGAGASLAATGVLKSPAHTSSPFFQLRRQGWDHWLDLSTQLQQETGIDVGYRCCGGIDIRDSTVKDPQRALAALPQTGGEVRVLTEADLMQLLPGLHRRLTTGLFIEQEATVDPKSLLAALFQSCLKSGVRIHEQLGPITVEPRGTDGFRLGGQIPDHLRETSDIPLVVTAGWESSSALLKMPPSPMPLQPVRGEAIALDIPAPPSIVTFDAKQETIVDEAGNRSRFSWIPAPDGKSWFGNSVGSESANQIPTTEPTALGLEQLLHAAQSLLGPAVRDRVTGHWAGIRPKAMRHGGPLLGRWPGRPDLWLATGHYRTGLLVGPMTARMMMEALLDDASIPDQFSIPG